ncbi:MAG: carbamoyl phosphate synthase small subunit [Clostridia bacterium]|nr:carbamoyl phosphate synthase small subunit [Clostridia bacterium]
MKGFLVLENGEVFEGERIGYQAEVFCEVVFNTGMAGYIETFTDPSYAGQGIVMTYPLIGNYGVIPEDFESDKIWASAVFIHNMANFESNFRSKYTIDKFLRNNNTPGLTGVNTRKLTRMLRESGTLRGALVNAINNKEALLEKIKEYKVEGVVDKVTVKAKQEYGKQYEKKVALIDYGFKHNIVNSLLSRKLGVMIYPARTKAEEILKDNPDGIMLSNGPGDPEECKEEIETLKELYRRTNKPIFGICLGHQLMALANGFKTSKLKYGHRGVNHPVKDLNTDRVYITSQNHGYYVLESSINKNIAEVSYINLNDGTVEGINYKNKNITTVQFHPESCPGPEDTSFLFDTFARKVKGEI